MFDFLRAHQVDIMLCLSSICVMLAFFTAISKIMSKQRKRILLTMELCASLWLEADRISYIYKGHPGIVGFWIVRISIFLVFLMTVTVLMFVTFYLVDALRNEGGLNYTPLSMRIAMTLGNVAIFLVILSQFTGLYYTFDENNLYQRSPNYFVSYIFPYIILLLQLGTLIYYGKRLKGRIAFSIFMFVAVCLLASLIQYFSYGISLVDMAAVAMVVGLYVFALVEMNERVEHANKIEINNLKDGQESMRRLFGQTATALATAIDAKDPYTQGHSERVAEYSKEIARLSGMDEHSCDEVYYAGLLHDVGKIGVLDSIIRKDVDLTPEEYESLKQHPVIGAQILSIISEYPFLSIGAKYHHERYDGKGYPEGLSGDSIPEIARIVAVADTYDSMTSKRSYRDSMPQATVREEIAKGEGTQFDPKYSHIMLDMIDHDTEYLMREKDSPGSKRECEDLTAVKEMNFGDYKENSSEGIRIKSNITRISFDCQADIGFDEKISIPTIVLFDAFDGCIHRDDRSIRLLQYTEYAEIWLDGNVNTNVIRNMTKDISNLAITHAQKSGVTHYDIAAVRYEDHVRVKIKNGRELIDVILALSESGRFCYLSLTGEHCHIMNISVDENGEAIDENYIPRIAEKISYIDRIDGDLPNVQIDGYRKDYSQAVPVIDGMRIMFRTMSLPSANLIWHCAYMLIFSADDALPNGKNYVEHGCVRLDGEDATNNDLAHNELTVHKDASFKGWDEWKKFNKKGFSCEITIRRKKDRVIMETSNGGISIKSMTTIPAGYENVYLTLTGDQCAITNIRITSI